ncbi:unnamed protein product [Amaranthus hypochondriacus]
MFLIIRVSWVLFFTCFFTLFGLTRKCLFRFKQKFITQKKFSNFRMIQIQPKENHQLQIKNGNICVNSDGHKSEEEEESEPKLRFRFPSYEEFLQNTCILPEKSDDKLFNVEEISKPICEGNPKENKGSFLDEFVHVENVVYDGEIGENLGEIRVENGEKPILDLIDSMKCENELSLKSLGKIEHVMKNSPSDDDESLVSDSDSDSIARSSVSSFRSSIIDSFSDGLLSDIDFERAFEIDTSKEFGVNEVNSTKEILENEDVLMQNLSKGYEGYDFDEEDEDLLDELENFESNLDGHDLSKGYEADECDDEDEDMLNKLDNLDKEQGEQKGNEEKTSSGEQLSSDSDEQNGLETQWEHQDLVEQLKMEIRKVRAIGLPTILEESESPKITDDLKPWKIVEKYHHGGTLDEMHKFYKTYKERMRKLDILNYQKMYAIGFLRLKDPLHSFTNNKISTSSLATIVSLDCWPCKPKSVTEIHLPVMKKFSKELESDLEMVYVGQMCLSWELLRWQYGKAVELWETDTHEIHQYNDVADKFQTFQVLLNRFLEDELFQGPRVYNYVRNRCVNRNLLQVPLIRDDSSTRGRRKEKIVVSTKNAITSSQLVEIIEESIRILWKFIKSDKDTNNNNATLLKCRRGFKAELQNPADTTLLEEVRSTIQKVVKRLLGLCYKNNLQITTLKFSTFANYSINVCFLRITIIKVLNSTFFRPNHRIPTVGGRNYVIWPALCRL